MRSHARQEFGRIKSIVLTVRAVFWAEAGFSLVQALLWHAVVADLLPEDARSWHVLVTAACWGQVLLMVAGALLVLRAPLVWTTVGACFATLSTIVGLWGNDLEVGVGGGFQMFLLVAFWVAVAQAARVQRLMAADPKLQIVVKPVDPSRRVVGGVADSAREHRRELRRQAWRGRLRLFGAVVVLLVGAGFLIRQMTKPPAVELTIARFAECWTHHEVDGIRELFPAGLADRGATTFREEVERRGWLADLPKLGEAAIEASEGRAKVVWPCAAGEVRATLQWDGRSWQLAGVALPKLVLPELAPALTAFRAAWSAAGTAALVDLMRPQSRERLGAVLARLLERRQWHENRPALGDVDPGQLGTWRARVLFALGNDELEVAFEFWHPQWYVVTVKLPRE